MAGTPTPPGTRSRRPWPSWKAQTLPGLLYASGLAAVSSALSLVPAGGVLVMPSHSYAGSLVMATELADKGFLELRTVDIADTDAVLAQLAPAGGKLPACSGWKAPPTPCWASRTSGR